MTNEFHPCRDNQRLATVNRECNAKTRKQNFLWSIRVTDWLDLVLKVFVLGFVNVKLFVRGA